MQQVVMDIPSLAETKGGVLLWEILLLILWLQGSDESGKSYKH